MRKMRKNLKPTKKYNRQHQTKNQYTHGFFMQMLIKFERKFRYNKNNKKIDRHENSQSKH